MFNASSMFHVFCIRIIGMLLYYNINYISLMFLYIFCTISTFSLFHFYVTMKTVFSVKWHSMTPSHIYQC